MGLGSQFSVLQSMDDNEIIPSEELGILGETKLNGNGSYHVEDVNRTLLEETKIGGTTVGSAFPGVNKRSGLKKWRRIPRELVNKIGTNLDGRNGDFTVSPAGTAIVNVNGDSGSGPVFGARADSVNSEDQNSRSSTAASVPGITYDDQKRNGQIGPGKKARGFKSDVENLNSTMGSDSRSSNFVFVQGSNTAASKGRQSGKFAKYDDESSDDAYSADKRLNEEYDDVSQEHVAADNIEKLEGSINQDPLVESIKGLHLAQEELEREVQKWRDFGTDDSSTFDNTIQEILEIKDAKILELESALNSGEVKTEVEDCLMKIIQSELEYVVITATTKSLTEGALHANKLDLQETNLSTHDIQATKKQDEKLEIEDVKKLQNRVFRCTSYVMIQLLLLLVTIYLIYVPHSVEFVPT